MVGKLRVVGIGPGAKECRTIGAIEAIKKSQVVVGYNRYIQHIDDLIEADQEVIANGMKKEVVRVGQALEKVKEGKDTVIVSSGDSGVYGMAGLALEMCHDKGLDVDVEVVPGVSAANGAAAVLGAPLMCDFAVISMSDLLVPWEQIQHRLIKLAEADMVTVIYNPKSKKRIKQLEEAVSTFLEHRSPDTPVGIVRNISLEEQTVKLAPLGDLPFDDIDMLTTLVVGNSQTEVLGERMVTRRGYRL